MQKRGTRHCAVCLAVSLLLQKPARHAWTTQQAHAHGHEAPPTLRRVVQPPGHTLAVLIAVPSAHAAAVGRAGRSPLSSQQFGNLDVPRVAVCSKLSSVWKTTASY